MSHDLFFLSELTWPQALCLELANETNSCLQRWDNHDYCGTMMIGEGGIRHDVPLDFLVRETRPPPSPLGLVSEQLATKELVTFELVQKS